MKRLACGTILGVMALAPVPGCSRATVHHVAPNPDVSVSRLPGRIEAASKISDVAVKDQSLCIIARDAAQVGAAELALQAVDLIGDMKLRDDAAAEAALELPKHRSNRGGPMLAAKIADTARRDAVLKKLA